MIKICTIGFTQTTAKDFFDSLKKNNIKTLIDTRINNNSQLAGFSKKEDLKYFLQEICSINYIHETDLAPTKELLAAYKDGKVNWNSYEDEFKKLIEKREIEKKLSLELIDHSCLLCSEKKPHFCHRRLVAEYLKDKTDFEIQIKHL